MLSTSKFSKRPSSFGPLPNDYNSIVSAVVVLGLALFCVRTELVGSADQTTRTAVLSLLKQAEAMGPFRCVRTDTIPQPPDAPKQPPGPRQIWQKGGNVRIEMIDSPGAFELKRSDALYIAKEEPGKYWKFPLVASAKEIELYQVENFPADGVIGFEKKYHDLLDSPTLAIIGVEKIDGKDATVVEYMVPDWLPGIENRIKLWLWNANGLPLMRERVQVMVKKDKETETELYRWTTVWKDFVFEDIPDTLFAIPSGSIEELPPDSWATYWTS